MNPMLQPGGIWYPGPEAHAPRLRHHPFAAMFPMLIEDEERKGLRESLASGQNPPVILFQGAILDGRNRERELFELKKPISYVQFVGTEAQALEWVWAENF